MTMHRVVLIDDEPLSRALIKKYLLDFPSLHVVEECGDGFSGVKAIQQHKPDLILLDIHMPKISGLEMLELLEEYPSVIFITAHDDYAIKAFEANALDYLLKPVSPERFKKAIEKFLQQPAPLTAEKISSLQTDDKSAQQLVVKTGTKIKIIHLADVLYIESDDDYITIHTAEGKFLKKYRLQELENKLPAHQFVRVHRSYIIPLAQLTRLEPDKKDSYLAVLRNGTTIPVSKTGYQKLKEQLAL